MIAAPFLICDVGAALRIGIANRSSITKHDTALDCTLARGTAEDAVVVLVSFAGLTSG
jgi:hypothetical protein